MVITMAFLIILISIGFWGCVVVNTDNNNNHNVINFLSKWFFGFSVVALFIFFGVNDIGGERMLHIIINLFAVIGMIAVTMIILLLIAIGISNIKDRKKNNFGKDEFEEIYDQIKSAEDK